MHSISFYALLLWIVHMTNNVLICSQAFMSFTFTRQPLVLVRRINKAPISSIPFSKSIASAGHASGSSSNNRNNYTLTLRIPTPSDMEEVAALISVNTQPGDAILLDGDLGAGKTCFSRGFIRARSGYQGRVTSPTFLLSNEYVAGRDKIHHLDLYRLNGTVSELMPLNLKRVFHEGIALIEWPDRLVERPSERLDVTLNVEMRAGNARDQDDEAKAGLNIFVDADAECRIMKLRSYGDRWTERLKFYEMEGYFEDLIVDNE